VLLLATLAPVLATLVYTTSTERALQFLQKAATADTTKSESDLSDLARNRLSLRSISVDFETKGNKDAADSEGSRQEHGVPDTQASQSPTRPLPDLSDLERDNKEAADSEGWRQERGDVPDAQVAQSPTRPLPDLSGLDRLQQPTASATRRASFPS